MIITILKIVAAGMLGGLLLFAIPFLLFKAFFFFLFIGLFFRLAGGRRRSFGRWRNYHPYDDHYDLYEPYRGKESLQDYSNQRPINI
jgi:hypothetical protein